MKTHEAEQAAIARAIGEPARLTMLHALLGGVALPAGTLARRAHISAGTASVHLARLVAAGLLLCTRHGRERRYALAGADVAEALEALARITPARTQHRADARLRFARTCYDHLAGQLGVQLTEHLVARGLLSAESLELSEAGMAWLASWDVDVARLRSARRPLTRPCMDWTERRNHLAGAAGAALASTMLERGWIARLEDTRAVRLTLRGREALYRSLGLEIAQ